MRLLLEQLPRYVFRDEVIAPDGVDVTIEDSVTPTGDVCDPAVFDATIQSSPIASVLVRGQGCNACDVFTKALTAVGQSDDTPLIDLELFSNDPKEDPCNVIADKLKVTHTPTFVRFKDGKEVGRIIGSGSLYKDKDALRKLLKEK